MEQEGGEEQAHSPALPQLDEKQGKGLTCWGGGRGGREQQARRHQALTKSDREGEGMRGHGGSTPPLLLLPCPNNSPKGGGGWGGRMGPTLKLQG